MGMWTGLLAATMEELAAAAPGWAVAEYGPYEERTVINPFTRAESKSWGFKLLTAAPKASPDENISELIAEEHRAGWGNISEHLAALMARLAPGSGEEQAKLGRQALVGPDSAETWAVEVPDVLTAALAALNPTQIDDVANAVQGDLDMSSAPVELVTQLNDVAKRAVSSGRRMFYYQTL